MKRLFLIQSVILCVSVTAFAHLNAFMGSANQGNVVSSFDADTDKSLDVLQTYDEGAGEIQFQKKSIDLGDINTDEQPMRVEFIFKNVGNAPLIIKSVIPSYREFDVSFPESSIAPGAEAVIVVSGTVNPGHFKKAVTVKTTGNIEYSRLYISGNNTGYGLSEPTFVGESVRSWVSKHIGTIKDLPEGIGYHITIRYKVGPDNKIQNVEYTQKGLPQAIVEDINRLINNMPVFESGHRRASFFEVNYDNKITNPYDKPEIELFEKDPIELLKIINHAKRHIQNNRIKGIFLWYVIERDGAITNIRTNIDSDEYSDPQALSNLKTFISEIRNEVKKKNVKSSVRRKRTEHLIDIKF